jgi:hypothetical protein
VGVGAALVFAVGGEPEHAASNANPSKAVRVIGGGLYAKRVDFLPLRRQPDSL